MKTIRQRVFSLLLSLCMLVGLLPAVSQTAFAEGTADWAYPTSAPTLTWGGSGTEEDPYTISTAQELADLAYVVNNDDNENPVYYGKCFKLTADIDLNPGFTSTADGFTGDGTPQAWTPIGYLLPLLATQVPFVGKFDGDHHTISGLYIPEGGSNTTAGLFGFVADGGIYDVKIANSYIKGRGSRENGNGAIISYGYPMIGFVAAVNCTTIDNCHVSDSYIDSTALTDSLNGTGGVIGENYGALSSILNCSFSGGIKAMYSGAICPYIGGIVGDNNGYVYSCVNYGSVYSDMDKIGGIVGMNNVPDEEDMENNAGVVEKCINHGTVSGGDYAGGIVGMSESWWTDGTAYIKNCKNYGEVKIVGELTSTSVLQNGGIVGYCNDTEVIGCYNYANVETNAAEDCSGAIAGKLYGTTVLKNCGYVQNDTINTGLNIYGSKHTDVVGEPVYGCGVVYTIQFDHNDGSDKKTTLYSDVDGKMATLPTINHATDENKVFGGWYEDKALTDPWNFNTDTVTQDITLYAKWNAEEYDVYVAGVQVTSDNKNDVLDAGGSVKYDPATKTLTLTDATIENKDGSGIEAKGNITIHGVDTEADGTNAIAGSTHAIQTIGGDITITGTLGNITGGSEGGITATVTTNGDNSSIGGNILIDKNAVVGDITSEWYTLQTDKGSITIDGEIGHVSGQIGITSESSTGHDTIINGKVGDITGVDHGIFSYGKLTINEGAQVGDISGGLCGVIANSDITFKGQVGSITGTNHYGVLSQMGKVTIESTIGTVKSINSVAAVVGSTGIELGKNVAIKTPVNSTIKEAGASKLHTVYDTTGTNDTIARTVEFGTLYTVSFDSKGGSDVASQAVLDGQTAVKPANPTRGGYTFAGWYSTEDYTTSYDFADAVTADITLYAKWNVVHSNPTYTPTVEDTAGGNTTVNDKNPEKGDKVTITTEPDEGYVVGEVAVTDKNGNPVEVIDNGDGTYTYVQPTGKVTITVTYTCSRDEHCPIWPYTDARPDTWYHDGVHYALDKGLMIGTGEDRFSPAAVVTRSQIATCLWRLENSPQVNYAMNYTDVVDGRWYTEAVRWVASQGIMLGYDNGRFGPDDPMTREQMVVIFYRYAQYKGYDVSIGENTNILSFADAEDVSEYALPAMQWGCGVGLIEGQDGKLLNPTGGTERAQLATIFMRFCEDIAK